jgi:hypothetical protein
METDRTKLPLNMTQKSVQFKEAQEKTVKNTNANTKTAATDKEPLLKENN